ERPGHRAGTARSLAQGHSARPVAHPRLPGPPAATWRRAVRPSSPEAPHPGTPSRRRPVCRHLRPPRAPRPQGHRHPRARRPSSRRPLARPPHLACACRPSCTCRARQASCARQRRRSRRRQAALFLTDRVDLGSSCSECGTARRGDDEARPHPLALATSRRVIYHDQFDPPLPAARVVHPPGLVVGHDARPDGRRRRAPARARSDKRRARPRWRRRQRRPERAPRVAQHAAVRQFARLDVPPVLVDRARSLFLCTPTGPSLDHLPRPVARRAQRAPRRLGTAPRIHRPGADALERARFARPLARAARALDRERRSSAGPLVARLFGVVLWRVWRRCGRDWSGRRRRSRRGRRARRRVRLYELCGGAERERGGRREPRGAAQEPGRGDVEQVQCEVEQS
ncbi:uncharacterized protein RHOBADRAFT_54719, partial [Rhodotorula graminis WP1]